MNASRTAAVAAMAVTAATWTATAMGARRWDRATGRVMARLDSAVEQDGAVLFSPDELTGLPAPVRRYFRFALTPGQPVVRSALVEQEGTFQLRRGGSRSPFTAVQRFTVKRPGFVWDARIRLAPLVTVRVRDYYVGGRAGMLGNIAALLPVVRQEDTPGLASGALHRRLLESPWLPTSLLPSQGVRWDPINESSARATLVDGELDVSMVAHFGDDGGIERVEALRMRDVDGAGVPTPFVGYFGDYEKVAGMRVPMTGHVEWVLPEGRHDFWHGRITRVEYRMAAPAVPRRPSEAAGP